MMWSALCEKSAQDWIGENLGIEQLLEAVQRLFSAGMLVLTLHLRPLLPLSSATFREDLRAHL
jgi:hypothetical protein